MSPEAIVSLLDSVTTRVPPNVDAGARGPTVRKQAALVRALLDEVEHCAPADRWVVGIRQQLDEEAARLKRLLVDTPDYGVHAA